MVSKWQIWAVYDGGHHEERPLGQPYRFWFTAEVIACQLRRNKDVRLFSTLNGRRVRIEVRPG